MCSQFNCRTHNEVVVRIPDTASNLNELHSRLDQRARGQVDPCIFLK